MAIFCVGPKVVLVITCTDTSKLGRAGSETKKTLLNRPIDVYAQRRKIEIELGFIVQKERIELHVEHVDRL